MIKINDILCYIKQVSSIQNLKSMAETFSLEAFIFVIILMLYILTSHVIQEKKVPYLHQSTMAIFTGVLTAVFAKYGLDKQIEFSGEVFFTIILPPIIFSAGYSLRKSLFFENFAVTGFLGIIGTIIGFICMTAVLIFVNDHIFQALTLSEIMMISSVLCATDTVAAMALIKPDKYPVLNAVLFGEGIINDAVAIILFRTIQNLNLDEAGGFTWNIIFKMTFDFTYLFFFSVAFGAIAGFGLSYLFKIIESFNKYPLKETSLILLNGYFTYLMGELLGLSGIITLFTCAIIMGHYCFMNISDQSRRGTGLAFETVSYIAEAFVFAYLGASILSVEGKFKAVLIALTILITMPFIRAIMVYIMPLAYKIFKRPFPMNDKELKVCWYSGMVRGVIAFALCLQIQSKDKKYIITIAIVIVMLTTIIGSTFLKNFIRWTGMKDPDAAVEEEQDGYDKLKQQKLSERNTYTKYKEIGSQKQEKKQEKGEGDSKFQKFESKFIKPIFQKQKKKRDITYEMQEVPQNSEEAH